MICSDWCRVQYGSAIERGDTKAAQDYMEMYQLWLDRENSASTRTEPPTT